MVSYNLFFLFLGQFGIWHYVFQKISGCLGTNEYKDKFKGKKQMTSKNSWIGLGESSRNKNKEI